jgi:type II secretory pathway component PulJ
MNSLLIRGRGERRRTSLHRNLCNERRAFTLFESILALGLVVVLSALVFAFVRDLSERRERVIDAMTRQRGVDLLLDGVESDLFATAALAPDGSPGISGRSGSIEIFTRGVSGGTQSDGVYSRYEFRGGRIEVARREQHDTRPLRPEVVAESVSRVRFRYFDGKTWSSSFSSDRQGLPVAVEVAVWMTGRGTRDIADSGNEADIDPPDRRRVIGVPDGPATGWKGGA